MTTHSFDATRFRKLVMKRKIYSEIDYQFCSYSLLHFDFEEMDTRFAEVEAKEDVQSIDLRDYGTIRDKDLDHFEQNGGIARQVLYFDGDTGPKCWKRDGFLQNRTGCLSTALRYNSTIHVRFNLWNGLWTFLSENVPGSCLEMFENIHLPYSDKVTRNFFKTEREYFSELFQNLEKGKRHNTFLQSFAQYGPGSPKELQNRLFTEDSEKRTSKERTYITFTADLKWDAIPQTILINDQEYVFDKIGISFHPFNHWKFRQTLQVNLEIKYKAGSIIHFNPSRKQWERQLVLNIHLRKSKSKGVNSKRKFKQALLTHFRKMSRGLESTWSLLDECGPLSLSSLKVSPTDVKLILSKNDQSCSGCS